MMRGVLFNLPSWSIVSKDDIAIMNLIGRRDDVGYGDFPELIVNQFLEICTAEWKVINILDDMRKDLLLYPAEGLWREWGGIRNDYPK